MPELPEVQTVVDTLASCLMHRKIKEIEVNREKNIVTGVASFRSILIGKEFLKMGRKGKFLLFYLEGFLMIAHLRMEGKYFFYEADVPQGKHDIFKIIFEDGSCLIYNDVRKFGTVEVYPLKEAFEKSSLAKLGPDPFDADPKNFYEAIHKSILPIKSLLMDQTIVAGIGNIYADEILFASRLHPLTKGKEISFEKAKEMLSHCVRILNEAIEEGGSSVRSYHPAEGIDGRMQNRLLAYGRKGDACVRCKRPMRTIFVNGRSATYCPKCQIHAGHPFVIALTGPIHSGKSSAARYLSEKGYPLFDCDKEIKKLYRKNEVIKKVSEILGNEVIINGKLSMPKMRAKMKDKEVRSAVTNSLYPLLRKSFLYLLNRTRSPYVIAEIPLFKGSCLEDLVDYLILVDAPIKMRVSRLEKEGKDTKSLLSINASYPLADTKKEASYIIVNDMDLKDLYASLDNLRLFD